MYTVLEISQLLRTSKATIYRKLESIDGILEHILIRNNTKYIDDEGFELIKKSINSKYDIKEQIKSSNTKSENDLTKKHEKYIENLEDEIDFLREEIQKKNSLIEQQSQQLSNSQLLLIENRDKLMALENTVAATKEKKSVEVENINQVEQLEEDKENTDKKEVNPIKFIKKVLNKKAYS